MVDLGEAKTKTDDLFKLSSGVGHHYRPGYYFPDSTFHGTLHDEMPPSLVTKDEALPEERFKTTYGTTHDPKYPIDAYAPERVYSKPPGHWNVNYVKDFLEKMDQGNFRRPLNVGNMKTETQDKFVTPRAAPLTGPTVDDFQLPRPKGPRPFLLNDHLFDGPTKQLPASTSNEKLRGRPFYPREKGVLNLNDTYLTTYGKYHRSFKPTELNAYPRKDVATYWDLEGHPKAWGHGVEDNPVPRDAVPREPLPMRDESQFKEATKVRHVPRRLPFVPHTGLRTETQAAFQTPNSALNKWNWFCEEDTPYLLPRPSPTVPYSAPGMYRTEYQNIGDEKPITV